MRNPGACGVKVTCTEHEEFAAIVPVQPVPIEKSRPGVPCVTTWTEAFVTVATGVKVNCFVMLHGDWPIPPCGQTLALPKLLGAKLALTLSPAFMVTVQVALVPDEAHAPPQPTNEDPAAGIAVSVTWVPL
jgi:hypothetical protein